VKKKNWLLVSLFVFLLAIFTACDPWSTYPSDGQYGQNTYDGDLTWTKVSSSNGWVARYKNASTVFNDSLWIIGGYGYQGRNKDSYLEDVWSSSDGVTWKMETMNAPWHGRTGHAVVVLNDKMVLIGGYAVDEEADSTHETNHYMNDVWSSSDGVNWTKVCDAPFGERAYHAAIVVNNTIYVIGGRKNGTDYYDDIWKSTDIEHWTQVPLTDEDKETLGKRAGMAVASVDSKIYIQGGYTSDYEIAQVNQTDWKKIRVFDTDEGTIEKKNRPGSPYNNRALMQMSYYNDKFYLFSGVEVRREYNMDYDEAYSTWIYDNDNNTWVLDSAGSGFGPRYGYTSEIFDGKIWVLGGWSYTGPKNDVWTAEVEK